MYTYIALKANEQPVTFIEKLREGFTHPINITQILDKISRFKSDEDVDDRKLLVLFQNLKIKVRTARPFSRKKSMKKKEVFKSSKLNTCRKIFLLLLSEQREDFLIFTNFLLKYLEHPNEYLRELTFSIIEHVEINRSVKKQALMKEMENQTVYYLSDLVEEVLLSRNLENYFIENYRGGGDHMIKYLIPEILQKYTFHPKFYLKDVTAKIIGIKKLREYLIGGGKNFISEIKNFFFDRLSEDGTILFEALKTVSLLMDHTIRILEEESFVDFDYKIKNKRRQVKIANCDRLKNISSLVEKLNLCDQYVLLQFSNLYVYYTEDIICSLISIFHIHLIEYLKENKYLVEIYRNSDCEGKMRIFDKIDFSGKDGMEILNPEENSSLNFRKLEILNGISSDEKMFMKFLPSNVCNFARYVILNKKCSSTEFMFDRQKLFYEKFNGTILNSQRKLGRVPIVHKEFAGDLIEDVDGPIIFENHHEENTFTQLTALTDLLYVEAEYHMHENKALIKLHLRNNSSKALNDLIIFPFSQNGNNKPISANIVEKGRTTVELCIPFRNTIMNTEVQFIFSYGESTVNAHPLILRNEKDYGIKKLENLPSIWKSLEWENNLNLHSVNFERLRKHFYLSDHKKYRNFESYIFWNNKYSIINIMKGRECKVKIRSFDENSTKLISELIKT